MTPPLHPIAAPASEADFFAALALCLGLPPAGAAMFRASTVFTGPAGLACRVAWHAADGVSGGRPEILLPLSTDELAGPDVRQLLTVQALLLGESGWYLGLSGEGLLQISPLVWMNRPADVAAALDVGNLLGTLVLERMGRPPGAAGPAGPAAA
jgi:hypothetical protein